MRDSYMVNGNVPRHGWAHTPASARTSVCKLLIGLGTDDRTTGAQQGSESVARAVGTLRRAEAPLERLVP
jgi:hypothetical protein